MSGGGKKNVHFQLKLAIS